MRRLRPRNRLQARLAAVVLLAVASIIGADANGLWSTRAQTLRIAQDDTDKLARALAEQTSGLFQAMDLLLLALRQQAETGNTAPPGLGGLEKLLSIRAPALAPIHRLLVADARGRVLVAAQTQAPPLSDISATDLFAHHRATADPGHFLGAPVRDPADGSWVLTLSRRLNGADGTFAGVVAASVTCDTLMRIYAGFSTGPHGMVLLARDDGVLMARSPMRQGDLGRDLSHGALFSRIVGPGDRPSFEFVSLFDGLVHLGSYRRVPDMPLLVMVGQAKGDILAGWRRTVAMHAAGLSFVIALILFLTGSLLRRIETAEQTQTALLHSNARLAESEARMAHANRWLEMAEELAQVGHWVLSLHGERSLVWSDELYRLYGVEKDSFVPDMQSAAAVFDAQDRAVLTQAIARAEQGETCEVALRLIGSDGGTRHILCRVGPQLGDDGAPVAVFGVAIDVTAQKRNETALVAARATAENANLSLELANRALEALAMQDALTGLSNRRHFDLALDGEFRRAVRVTTSLALILIDVDQFKQYNDMYGHQAGDACLRAIAGILPRFLKRHGDMAARYGGEELAVLLPGNTVVGARDLAMRMAAAVRALGLVHAGSQHGIVTISAGVEAFVPVHDINSAAELVEHADLALYAAKRAGRDRVFAYGDLGSGAGSRPERDAGAGAGALPGGTPPGAA